MSLNQISNSVFPNTLNGLDSLNVTNITINGETLNTLFVPYTGAVSNTDLNNKSLTGVNSLSASSVTASGLVQALNVTATGLTSSDTLTTTGLATLNSVRVSGIAAGTAVNKVGVTSGGTLISIPLASQPDVTTTTSNINYFPTLVQYSGPSRDIYVDDTNPSIALRYNPSTSTLYAYVSEIPTLTTATSFTALGTNNIAGYATLASPAFSGNPTAPTQPTVDNSTRLATTEYVNNVIAATPISQPTVTGTQTNATYHIMFAPNSTTTPNSAVYVDSGGHLIYNPDINTLYVSFLQVTQITSNCTFTAIVSGATAAPGTNTTQLATTAFVQTAVGSVSGFLTKTGTQTGINTTLQLLNSSSIFKVEGGTVRTYLCMDAALDRVEIGELRVLYGTVCQAGLSAGNYVSVTGTSNPVVEIGGTLVVGKASAATGLIGDSGAGDMCVINYNTDIRFAARQSSVTNLFIGNTEVVAFPTLRTNSGASFRIAGNQLAGYNSVGLFADNAGYFTNHVGALTVGLTGTNSGDMVLYANASGEMKFYTGNTRAITLNFNGMELTRQYLHLSNAANPYLNVTPAGGAGNFFAQATGPANFISDAGTGDLCINSRTGNIRLAGGAQYGRTNLLITNGNVQSNVPMVVVGNDGSPLRLCYFTTSGYGAVYHNNGYGLYTLLTNNGDPLGGFNGLRPFTIIMGTGQIISENGQNFYGGIDLRNNVTFHGIPKQSYISNAVMIGYNGARAEWGTLYSYYYANNGIAWGGGVLWANLFKESATSLMRVSGSISHYIGGAGMTHKIIRFYHADTGTNYDYNIFQYTNLTGNHASYPCMVQTGVGLPVGTYYVYLYAITNIITDTNDTLYLLAEIVPS